MLVQHGFGDSGGVCDVVHRRSVVALGGEDIAGCVKQLDASLVTWQAGRAAARRVLLHVRRHEFTLALWRPVSAPSA